MSSLLEFSSDFFSQPDFAILYNGGGGGLLFYTKKKAEHSYVAKVSRLRRNYVVIATYTALLLISFIIIYVKFSTVAIWNTWRIIYEKEYPFISDCYVRYSFLIIVNNKSAAN